MYRGDRLPGPEVFLAQWLAYRQPFHDSLQVRPRWPARGAMLNVKGNRREGVVNAGVA